jgi:hypothetical protein
MAFRYRVKGELFDTILTAFVSRSLHLLSEFRAPLFSYPLSFFALYFSTRSPWHSQVLLELFPLSDLNLN